MQLPHGRVLLSGLVFGKPLLGVVPLTFVFAALQHPLLTKYAVTSRRK
jgi:hypothetical protein